MRLSSKAADRLFRQHNQALYRLARRRVGLVDAEDLVQDTYLKLFEMEDPEQIVDTKGYLFRVTSNAAIDCLRKRRARSAILVDTVEFDEIGARASTPATASSDAIMLRRVQRRLSELPRNCRDAFLLSRLYGLTYPEIAQQLGISLRTVNRNICVAVDRLRLVIELGVDEPKSEQRRSTARDRSGPPRPADSKKTLSRIQQSS